MKFRRKKSALFHVEISDVRSNRCRLKRTIGARQIKNARSNPTDFIDDMPAIIGPVALLLLLTASTLVLGATVNWYPAALLIPVGAVAFSLYLCLRSRGD